MKMKTIYLWLLTAIVLCGCSDFLDREPKTNLSPASFWKSESDLRLATNVFYQNMNRSYTLDNQSADGFANVSNQVSSGTQSPGNTDAIWTAAYKQIRNANNFLENYQNAEVSDAVKNRYAGEARFFRAYFYFNLVKRFGDVPYVLSTLDMDSEELMGPRTPKEQVIAGIIEDLEFAETHIPLKSKLSTDVGRLTKGAAQAMLARVALYCGTRNKFHGDGEYKKYLQMAKEASKRLIDTKEYSLYKDYRDLFLLPGEDSDEHILSYRYSAEADTYNSRIRATIADPSHTPTKVLADAFLCKDGLPVEKSAYKVEYLPAGKEFENRDPRMALTLWKPGDPYLGKPFVPNLSSQTRTGYMFKKYGDEESYSNMKSRIDEILIRYAEVLLGYLECLVEDNQTITQGTLDETINAVRGRASVKMPVITEVNPAKLREIVRHERRIELAMEGIRYWDIMRWGIAHEVLSQKIWGAPYPNSTQYATTTKEVDPTGKCRWYVGKRAFRNPTDYTWPIPQSEQNINPNLRD